MTIRASSIISFALVFFLSMDRGVQGAESADLVITEFQATGGGPLLDEDKDDSDWIEIFNNDSRTVNLAGWSLTDSMGKIKWLFPDKELRPKRFITVFASGKSRIKPDAPFHTSFKLGDTGGYLGLIGPDGITVISEFSPKYPLQAIGASYGSLMESSDELLSAPGAEARFMVPSATSPFQGWTAKDLDDSAWPVGTTGLGYDAKTTPTYRDLIATELQTAMKGVNASVLVRIAFTVNDPVRLSTLALKMKYEDGFVAYVNGKEVARRNAPTALAWNSKAPTRHLEKDAIVFERIDISTGLDVLEPGRNVLAIHGLNESSIGSAFLLLPQLEASEVVGIHLAENRYFAAPTPGAVNGEGVLGIAQEPNFSIPGGAYVDLFSLALQVDSPQAVIHYTIDRKVPSESSLVYAAPIQITKTIVVRARTFEPGLLPSPEVEQTFTIIDPTLKDFSSNIPIVVINTFGQAIPDPSSTVLAPAYMSFFYPADGGRTILNGAGDVESQVGIKYRGSSSFGFPKKNIRLETWDGNGKSKSIAVLGLPKESDWALYGPYTDKTFLRDVLAFDFSNSIGRYAPRTQFFELYLSSSAVKLRNADYQGVYAFMEKIKWGKDRVDVQHLYPSQNTEPEITGGYVLKKDRLGPGEAGFTTKYGQGLVYVDPSELPNENKVQISAAQRVWIKGFFDQFETALNGANYKDPVNGYAKFIDVDSFIDQHILVELAKNIDGYRLSAFMYKDREGKLNMGPAWDYNLSMGNANYLTGESPIGWYYSQIGGGDYPWYGRLQQDPAYMSRYKERWFAFRQNEFTQSNLLRQVDEYVTLLTEAEVRDHKKWPVLGIYIWPNWYIGKTYMDEINFMKEWLTKRLAWIDSQFISAPVFSQKGGAIDPGFSLTITTLAGNILYTIDGTDPKAADGSRSPSALDYTGPVIINVNSKVRARNNIGASWSAITEATFYTEIPPLVITEIMYKPAPPPAGSQFASQEDYEFVEIQNIGEKDLPLAGVQLTDSVKFNFTVSKVTSLPPGGYVIVVRNQAAFATRYDITGMNVAGQYTGSLPNTRGTVGLVGALGEPILRFIFDSTWYPETSGAGMSLVILDPKGTTDLWGKKEGWRSSGEIGGSPSAFDNPPLRQVPGDINQDGKLRFSDAIGLLRLAFVPSAVTLPCEGEISSEGNLAVLDVNDDKVVQIADPVYLLNYFFQGGPAPVAGAACRIVKGCPDACAP